MSQTQISCFACHHLWSYTGTLSRRDECPCCGSDARVCKNCSLYDPAAYRACREDQAEWVKEKDRANFCGYFLSQVSSAAAKRDPSLDKLDALFASPTFKTSETSSALKQDLESFFARRK